MVIFRLIVAFIVGLASHSLHGPTRKLGPKIGILARYAVGILLFLPMFIFVKHSLAQRDETTSASVERDLAAGLLTAGAQGSGTFLGYILGSHQED